MKRCLIILFCCCCLFNKLRAQSPSAAIDSLIKYQIIKVEDKPVLEKELKNNSHASYRIAILGGVESIIFQEKYHIDPHKSSFMISYGKVHLSKKSKDSINTALHILLNNIKKAGLLTDRVYTYTLKGIDTGAYVVDLQLIGTITEMSARLERLAPNKLLPVAEDLHKNGIVSDSSFVRLEDDIRSGKIESASQLNDYCKLDKVFDLTKYPNDPDVWLEQMHRDIASMLPGLSFTDFKYITIPDTSFSLPGFRFKVSFVCNGHTYKHTSIPFNNFKNKQGEITPKDIFAEDFHRIFNKILIDQHSPYQLHSVMFNAGSAADDQFRSFALIAINEMQTRAFMKKINFSYMSVSLDNYNPALTSEKVELAIAGWRKMGLFAQLSETEIEKGIDNLQSGDLFSMNQLLSNFPRVIYPIDSAMMSPDCPYVAILNHLAGISHGAFNPTQITQTKMNDDVRLQYLSNDKMYDYTFNTTKGWIDTKFMTFIKHLGLENNLAGNFYQLKYEDSFIYLNKEQYIIAKKNELLDLD